MINNCCYIRKLTKDYLDKNLEKWGKTKAYAGVEFLFKVIYNDICKDCESYYREIEGIQLTHIKRLFGYETTASPR
jgi:hypothetical protein